jgi:polyisoprenoid-binding protein YceI
LYQDFSDRVPARAARSGLPIRLGIAHIATAAAGLHNHDAKMSDARRALLLNAPSTDQRLRSPAGRCDRGELMSWVIDKVHSHVGFTVKHLMVTTVRGQFRDYSGSARLDSKDFARSTFEGEIEVASIDTGNADRDKHLRTNDFFDAENHPKITFKSTSISPKSEGEFVINGDITIRGVTKPIALDVEYLGTSKNLSGQTVAGLSVRGTVNRKDFGVNFNAVLEAGGLAVSEKVKLELDVELTQTQDA